MNFSWSSSITIPSDPVCTTKVTVLAFSNKTLLIVLTIR
jgi:hypothetical protein